MTANDSIAQHIAKVESFAAISATEANTKKKKNKKVIPKQLK